MDRMTSEIRRGLIFNCKSHVRSLWHSLSNRNGLICDRQFNDVVILNLLWGQLRGVIFILIGGLLSMVRSKGWQANAIWRTKNREKKECDEIREKEWMGGRK